MAGSRGSLAGGETRPLSPPEPTPLPPRDPRCDGRTAGRIRPRRQLQFRMQSTTLYQQILGLSAPWRVVNVDLNLPGKSVQVRVEHDGSCPHQCPQCGQTCPGYDSGERSWRHLDTCQMQTVLTAQVPRVRCPEHGVRLVQVPWAEPNGRFTALFEALVIEWLKVATIKAVATRMNLSWDQVDGIMSRAVQRGLDRRVPVEVRRVGVDETSFQKRHEYVTVVTNMDDGTVLHVADDRKAQTLGAWYQTLGSDGLARLSVVAMDMWAPYIAATRQHVPDADQRIVFDKFHVAKHLGEAVDKVRRKEHRELKAADDDRLTGTKYLWQTNPDTLGKRPIPPELLARFETLRSGTLRTARAYALKEAAMEIWDDTSRPEATASWKWWHGWAVRSQLEPIKRVAGMIKSHLTGILNAIVTGTTNAISESVNAKIQKVKRMACGFRNRDRFRSAIYFHLGGLDLYPQGVTHSNS